VFKNGSVSRFPEKKVIQDILSSINSSDVFFDIGANFGRYTCTIGKIHSGISITAFEPNPKTAHILKYNISENDIGNSNVYEFAASDFEGRIDLVLDEGLERARLKSSDSDSSAEVSVEAVRVDHFIKANNLAKPSVVKIDVEGAELRAIRGMRQLLRRPECRLVYCEVHPFLMEKFGDSEDVLLEELESSGFKIEVIYERRVDYKDGSEIQKFIRAERH
jgi:FkbM family methyltransferase